MSGGDFEDDWEPLTQAEMKVIQAKQERSNKISKIMGDYLLKGYKMLASSCDECGCILLQDKQNQLHCVACNECEVEGSKDDPALSQLAADSKIREGASPGAAAAAVSSGLETGVDAANALSSAATTTLWSTAPISTGIPSLMNASTAINGTAGSATEAGSVLTVFGGSGGDGGGGGSSGGGSGGSAGGGSGSSSSGGGKAPKGKTSSRSGNRASLVGVRSLMSDVGRGAYEAFAAYSDESPSSPRAVAASIASAAAASTVSASPSLPLNPPPHGPVVVPTVNGVDGSGFSGGGGGSGFLNGHVTSTIPVSRSPPSAASRAAPLTPGRLTPSDHECLTQTLKSKMISAGKKLEKSASNEEDKALCGLIKNYAEALEAVNRMQSAVY